MPLNFERLLPPAVLAQPDLAAAALPGAAMLRVNFVPGLRQRLGWRGMRECPHHAGGLTARVAGMAGVYGLAQLGTEIVDGHGQAEFSVAYFPAPEEELLEAFSVEACLVALAEPYLERVRDFAADPDLSALFDIARLRFVLAPECGVALSLHAPDRAVTVAPDGITVATAEGPRQVVASGGLDRDLRAFDCAMPFVEALVASIACGLEAAPTRLEQASMPGRSQSGEAASDVRLSIGWGDNPPMPGIASATQIDLRWADPEPRPATYAGAAWWQADTASAGHGLAKSTLGIQDKPKLIVLTGFLGAGKTSFLTHFIEYQAARNGFVAVVQNEIGAKGLDGQLLGQHYAVAEIDEGCVCCTLAGSLKLALGDILHSYQPDFVVLETTGLANPANLLSEIADLEDHLEFASVTTVIDARLGLQTLQRYAVARDQVRLADVILLNKVDGEADQDLAMLEAAVRRLNPVASMCRADHGDIAPSALYGVNLSMHRQPPIPEVVCCGAHGHGHDHEHGRHACGGPHTSTHDDDGLTSRIWTATGRLDRQALEKALSLLPATVLRVKGMVDLHGEAEPSVCQFVPGSYSLTPAGSVDTDERFLVFIGENIDDAVGDFIESLSRNRQTS
ncbi:MAG: GTP-binding protein [Rhodospirillales bacterium]|nr:GTP-binding protein [Rhodospirillales bacterium]